VAGAGVAGAAVVAGRRTGAVLLPLAVGAVAWGWFEAGWVRLRSVDVPIAGLPPELAGLRIAHLSDFHLGQLSRGTLAVVRGVAWAASRGTALTAVTGDLVSRPAAVPRLRRLLETLPRCYAVLGNHEVDETRDPFARGAGESDLGGTVLLVDDSRTLELEGHRVQVAGVDPRSYRRGEARPGDLADPAADLRILLCHYPYVLDRLPPGAFHLVLAGHMHDGQINLPYLVGKLSFAHPRGRYLAGLYRRGDTAMHVSPGLGTTFVPFRFAARPEATELVLRPA
jgi:predicted MPP superfamily phosphohydrolase